MSFWDQQFSTDAYKYGQQPNAFLLQHAPHFPPNSDILVPGDGEGRNGVWLAAQGHRVLSIDASEVGLRKARALAAQRGVHLDTLLADLATWTPAPASADAVVLTYVHLPPNLRPTVHRRLALALRPGGVLILEAFHPRQLSYASFGPKSEDLLYTIDLLRADFSPLLAETLAFEGELTLDEGPGHRGPGFVTRWLGRRSGTKMGGPDETGPPFSA